MKARMTFQPRDLASTWVFVLLAGVLAGCAHTVPPEVHYSPVRPIELGVVPDVVIPLEETDRGGQPVGGLRDVQRKIHYPDEARRNRISGVVQVRFVVSVRGEVLRAEVAESAHPLLDLEALRVVAHQRFEPAFKGQLPVAYEAVMPISFKLR